MLAEWTDPETRILLVTTVPGVEDLLLNELREFIKGKGVTSRGRVLFKCSETLTPKHLSRLISRITLAEKVYVIVREACVSTLKEVENVVKDAAELFADLLHPASSFAVRAEREGEHNFTSLELAKVVGSAIQRTLKPTPPVSLDDPDVLVYAELIDDVFRLGIDLTPFMSLKDRGYRAYVHPSSLNPIVARAMCIIAQLEEGETLLDPMCGSGTIVIEGLLYRSCARGLGFDVNPIHIAGAKVNALHAGVDADFAVVDVRRVCTAVRGYVDVIATNPPFGIRERAVGGLRRVYRALFEAGEKILRSGGRLVMLTPLRRLLHAVARARKHLEITGVRRVEIGGMPAYIYVFTRE